MAIGRIIDVSSAQHNDLPPGQGPAINWTQVAQAGVTGVVIKATQGTGYTNPWFDIDVKGALGNGIQVAAYHFADMGDPVAECNYFKQQAGKYARVLDYETNTSAPWARSFLQTLALPPDECMIYGSASALSGIYGSLPAMAWPAAYNQLYPGWGVMWQFTDNSSISGIPTVVDEDSWHGNAAQYNSFFQTAVVPPGPLPPASNPSNGDDMAVIEHTLPDGTVQRHVFGIVNGVAYHWFQEANGPNFAWQKETLPL